MGDAFTPMYQQPAPAPPAAAIPTVSFVALGLGLLGALVFPLAYLAVALFFPRNDVVDRLGPVMVVGALVVAAAFVCAIVGIVQSRARNASLVPSIIGLVLSLLAPFTGAASGFLAVLFAAGGGVHGRPFRVGAYARTARPERGDAWVDGELSPAVDSLARDLRERLASRWLSAALAEHASVAAFARLSLDLIAVGAPPALLTASARAAAEEVEHATACFAIAAALGGRPVGPGVFPEAAGGAARAVDLATLARDAYVDGCLGEGVAAELARSAAARCSDPAVRAALERIADEEAGHAALSWEIVRWCRAQGGDAVARALREAGDAAVALPEDETDDPAMLAWGSPAAGEGRRALGAVRAAMGAPLGA
jgi:hypothetical protein